LAQGVVMVAELVFWGSLALVFYAYAGYPLCLWLLALVRRRSVHKAPITPSVTFIITAHNEEARLPGKIENTLRQEYDGVIDVLVASDCSTDRTDEIAQSYGSLVQLVRAGERRGKEAAQGLAVRAASGEILVFSDVATMLDPDGVARIVRNFADPTVGCVSSTDRFLDANGRPSGEGAYVRYEMWLRTLETQVNTLVGLSGSFFAVRRTLCDRWATDRQSDFTTLLNSVDRGLRGVLDRDSIGYYQNIADERLEFQRKVRTVVRGLYVLATHRRLLNPLRYGMFAWQLGSHKLCRWLVPFALVTALVANAVLVPRSLLYAAMWFAQIAFYVTAAVGWRLHSGIVRVPTFFVLANLAVLVAWLRYLRGDRIAMWRPSERISKVPPASAP
jgi:glycosyltransferase involved in cell wall biosynthesis